MQIVTGFRHRDTPDWNNKLDNLKQSAERFGHEVRIFDLPTQDPWISGHYDLLLSLCWKYKVIFMREVLDMIDDDIVWIDGDCLMIKPIDFEEATAGCDLAFTLRDIKDRNNTTMPIQDGLINSGVVFLRNNQASRDFLKLAMEHLTCALYDQEAFNKVLIKHSAMESMGEVVEFRGIRVKMLNCREYNNFYFDSTSEDARILHFKGDGRLRYEAALKGQL